MRPLTRGHTADLRSVILPHLLPLGRATGPTEPQSHRAEVAKGTGPRVRRLASGPGFASKWLCGRGQLPAPLWAPGSHCKSNRLDQTISETPWFRFFGHRKPLCLNRPALPDRSPSRERLGHTLPASPPLLRLCRLVRFPAATVSAAAASLAPASTASGLGQLRLAELQFCIPGGTDLLSKLVWVSTLV